LDFKEQLESFRLALEEKEKARERLLKLVRELRMNSTKAIASIHARNLDAAKDLLRKASEIMDEVYKYKAVYPEIYAPITHDSMQEYVEAFAFLHVIAHKNLEIDLLAFKVEISSILTGLADLIGELRRYILDLLREGKFDEVEDLMGIMEGVYSNLLGFDFSAKLTPGLRQKIDAARWMIERTKSDFIAAKVVALGEKILNSH
jgi:translin